MIRANKELDLLRSYRRLMRGEKGRSGLLHHFLTPAAVCLLVCVLIWGVLLLMNSSLRRRTDDVNDWLRDPAIVEQYSEAASRQQYNDSLVQALGQVQALTDALATYPQVDSALISRIGAAGGADRLRRRDRRTALRRAEQQRHRHPGLCAQAAKPRPVPQGGLHRLYL